jgi:hypothetical protein
MQDKRSRLRVCVRIPVSCEVEGDLVFGAIATDISFAGLRIESADLPGFGAKLTIVAQLPGASDLSRLPATVRWVGLESFGVRFGLLGARDTYRIADLMGQALRAKRSE